VPIIGGDCFSGISIRFRDLLFGRMLPPLRHGNIYLPRDSKTKPDEHPSITAVKYDTNKGLYTMAA
jgi:hypothetical protein